MSKKGKRVASRFVLSKSLGAVDETRQRDLDKSRERTNHEVKRAWQHLGLGMRVGPQLSSLCGLGSGRWKRSTR